MTPDELNRRIADLLLKDVTTGKLAWYYISMAGPSGFAGACLVEARGEIEAFRLMHGLLLYPYDSDAETLTYPVPEDRAALIPDEYKWRRLSKADLNRMDAEVGRKMGKKKPGK